MSDLFEAGERANKRAQNLVGLGKAKKAVEGKFRTGATRTRREAATALQKQQRTETLRLAEVQSEIATSRAAAVSGQAGRRSLLKSSPSGLAINLGGTGA